MTIIHDVRLPVSLLILLAVMAGDSRAVADPVVIYVDAHAVGPVIDGTSWCTAFTDLQQALEAGSQITSDPVEIRVAEGTYAPAPPGGERTATFSLFTHLTLVGGYAGCGAPDPDHHDVATNLTTLTGDLNGDDTGEFDDPSHSDNAHHVVSALDLTGAILDGFTITGGHDDREWPDGVGGGLLADRVSLTVRRCDLRNNYALRGGAISVRYLSHFTLADCDVHDNQAAELAGGLLGFSDSTIEVYGGRFTANKAVAGGGAFVQHRCWFRVFDTVFLQNVATDDGGAIWTGGSSSSTPQYEMTLERCHFHHNHATGSGAAIECSQLEKLWIVDSTFNYNYGGGPIINDWLSTPVLIKQSEFAFNNGGVASFDAEQGPTILDCTFHHNTAIQCAGLYLYNNDAQVINSVFHHNHADAEGGAICLKKSASLINCELIENSAAKNGGALYVDAFNGSNSIINCTIAANSALSGGGVFVATFNGLVSLRNSILWANIATHADPYWRQVYLYSGEVQSDYSCIQGYVPSIGGNGNTGADPRFIQPVTPLNVRLSTESPCIDAAANTLVPPDAADVDDDGNISESVPLDIFQFPRFIDSAGHQDVGIGGPYVVDMGAYEFSEDCNANTIPDATDISTGTSHDCNGNTLPDECEPSIDCNANGMCDDADIIGGTSEDCNSDGVPDECQPDCNTNGVHDECDLASEASDDCNQDGIPDECLSGMLDCDGNGQVDQCEINGGTATDSNANGVPDVCEPRTIYVRAAARGGNTGLSWGDAYSDLQDALQAARISGGWIKEILVAEGLYTPAPPGAASDKSFELIDGVSLYGGFAIGEVGTNYRDPVAHPSILSGDLNGDDTGNHDNPSRFENANNVVKGTILGYHTVFDGFVIMGGHADDVPSRGGGLKIDVGSLQVSNCIFRDNYALQRGGAVYVSSGVPLLTRNRFERNHAGLSAGAVFMEHCFSKFDRCVFVENAAKIGGAVHAGNPLAHFIDCEFVGNRAIDGNGGAVSAARAPRFVRCRFERNSANSGSGGAVDCTGDAFGEYVRCTFAWNTASVYGGATHAGWGGWHCFDDCLFHNNSSHVGGAIEGDRLSCTLVNCTFVANVANVGGGIYAYEMYDPWIFTNCIFWQNVGGGMMNFNGQIDGDDFSYEMMNSCVQGWVQPPLNGNFGHDPHFVAPASGDFRLRKTSLLINAGANSAISGLNSHDLDGHARLLCGTVDMGAYEFGIGDFDCNLGVDIFDFAAWTNCQSGPGAGVDPGCAALDFDGDDDVDLLDWAGFQLAFADGR